MQTSESISNLAKSLILFHMKVDSIKKDAKNPFFKSKYASLSSIQDAITIPLAESGITITQLPDGEHGLTSILMHESGEFIMSTYQMKPVKNDPHGLGSVLTYMRRYSLLAILNLNVFDESDDDANRGTIVTKEDLQWLNKGTTEHEKVVAFMSSPDADINKVKMKYKLSKDMEKELINLKK
jgi:hypothetical protein